jgi:hypothetical protein
MGKRQKTVRNCRVVVGGECSEKKFQVNQTGIGGDVPDNQQERHFILEQFFYAVKPRQCEGVAKRGELK